MTKKTTCADCRYQYYNEASGRSRCLITLEGADEETKHKILARLEVKGGMKDEVIIEGYLIKRASSFTNACVSFERKIIV